MADRMLGGVKYDYQPHSLVGKNVLVTGGTTGIGRTTALLLASKGARVLIYGRSRSDLDEALKEIGSTGGQVFGVTADQTNPEDIQRVFAEVDSQLGGLDILVANAADPAETVLQGDYAQWHGAITDDLLGYMACCRYAYDRMKPKGEGHIVAVGSLSAKARNKGNDIYVAAKSGLEGFIDAFSKSVNEEGIRVSLIEPGKVGTDFQTIAKGEQPDEQRKNEAEGTELTAEDLAECIFYVLSQPKRVDVAFVQIRPVKQAI